MDKNKLQAYASIGEIVSAIAIVVSLLYAGYEFRHSGTMSNRDVEALLYERFREMNHLVVETPSLAELLIAGEADPTSLSDADKLRYEVYQRGFYNTWEMAWYYHRDGILDDVTWNDWDAYFILDAGKRSGWVWARIRLDFDSAIAGPTFQAHVDASVGRKTQ